MKNISSGLAAIFLLLLSVGATAQNTVEMADTMRAEGKIYVVVAIILVVLAGMILYLVFLDRKTKNLERQLQDKR